jgi:DNA-binding response OmpR family regulator
MSDRILVVDDDRSILALVCELLSDAGYRVQGTADPVEGLRLVQTFDPGLIVLDMRMPVLDGWQFRDELVARAIDTPIIVMTAAQDARRVAQEIQAAGYVAKPFDIDELLHVVGGILPPPPPQPRGLTMSVIEPLRGLRGGAVRRPPPRFAGV